MKFGFEHDSEQMTVDNSERTPLLAAGNVAPASDPTVAQSVGDLDPNTRTDALHGDHDSDTISNATLSVVNEDGNEVADKPLPVRQVLFLCFARLVEPIAFFSIFPYINQMCAENGNLPPSDTGFWSGMIESLFSLTQMLVMIIYGRLADRLGRKPVLVFSLFGVAGATSLFGLAKTLWQMILFRCMAGVFAGTVVTIRTMCTEHSTAKTQARIFSWFAFSGNLGILFGPLIGGALADPAKQYGGAFKNIAFFEQYPYALATLATGSIALIAGVLVILFVEETLAPRVKSENLANGDIASATSENGGSPKSDQDNSIRSVIKAPGVLPVLALYGHVMFLAFAYTAIMPVHMYEPVRLGGFGFPPLYISLFMALVGLCQAIWLLLIFPPLQHRIGTGGVLRLSANAYPCFVVAWPLLNLLLRQETHAARVTFFVITPIINAVGVGVSMAFTAMQLALNDVAPSPQTLGTLNAIALTVVSGIRAFAPAAATSVYAIGVRKQIIYGYLGWVVLFFVTAGFTVAIRWLPEKAEGKVFESQGRLKQGQESEEDDSR